MRTLAQVFVIALVLGGCGSTTPQGGDDGNQTTGVLPPQTTPTPTPVTPAPVTPAPVAPTTPTGAAGMAAVPTMPPPDPMVEPTPVVPPDPTKPVLAMDECGLDTSYAGDEYCINPPPADKGFQMHIGPSNYASPESRYVLEPGGELTETFTATSGNTTDVYYYWRQYRMRPGSHHLIISGGGGGGGLGGLGRRLGGSSNSAKDNPEAGIIAPENEGVGMPLAARSALSNSFHTFNFTDQPQLKEAWVNFWYRDAELVTEPTREVFSMLGMGIAPGQHVNAHGTCNITTPGRLLTVYGHVHANNLRFSVWRTRGTDKMLVHEAYDWEHPNISEYSSTVMNPALNPTAKADGGTSGILDLMPGDKVEFECEIINNTNSVFVGLNEAENDEMCILIGDTVGTSIPAGCSGQNIPVN